MTLCHILPERRGWVNMIKKTIQVRRTRHAGHCWRSRDELISDILLWTPTHGRAKAGRPARTYIQQLCEDTGCCPEDQPEAINDREKWRERVRYIRATSTTWWWWVWIYNNVRRVLANGPGDRCLIPGGVIAKTKKKKKTKKIKEKKRYLMLLCFNTHHYKIRIKRKLIYIYIYIESLGKR